MNSDRQRAMNTGNDVLRSNEGGPVPESTHVSHNGERSACLPLAVFWDMDGTLIDSEPYWHQIEIELAQRYGGSWTEDLGWQMSGKPLSVVAGIMRAKGLNLPAESIPDMLIDGVGHKEQEHMPWIDGVFDLLTALGEAHVPSVLVTTSPRRIAQVVVDQAPTGAFVDFVCGDDGLAQKPDPAPYLHAAELVGIRNPEDMASCIAFEDSLTGLKSAVASGATTLAFTGATPGETTDGPQFASFDSYSSLTPYGLGDYIMVRTARP